MARTTIDLDSTVLEQLREHAAAEHKSMGRVASERLAAAFAHTSRQPEPLHWPTKQMGTAKIDLEDKQAVMEVLERDGLER